MRIPSLGSTRASGAPARPSPVAALTALVLLLPASSSAAEEDAEIVRQLFPQALIREARELPKDRGQSEFLASAFAPARLDGPEGPVSLVAAYANLLRGTIGVIRRSEGGAELVGEPTGLAFAGGVPRIEAIDLEGDGRPEVAAYFRLPSGRAEVWLLRWDGTHLTSIGPVVPGDDLGDGRTELCDAGFLDLDGDGRMEVLNPPYINARQLSLGEVDPARGFAADVYRLESGVFHSSTRLYVYESFVRGTGQPIVETRDFSVPRSDAPYRIRVLSGGPDGADTVSSALVLMNGETVISPDGFDPQTRCVEAEVFLGRENRLAVEVRGAPGSRMTVLIEEREAAPIQVEPPRELPVELPEHPGLGGRGRPR